jgi:tRNA(adenine34) deaminase
MKSDEYWMRKALKLAAEAATRGEVPVGALLVKDGEVVATASNRREQWQTPLGHAELIALQRASQKLKAWRLLGCTLYVTLEPCVMCAGALVQARVDRVVYGATDPKGGAVHSLFQIGSDSRLNHQIALSRGVLEDECSQILKEFFKNRRALNKQKDA